jgi:transposase-like protein
MKCPVCSKKLEYFEEEETPNGISQRFTCKHCVAVVDVTRLNNKLTAEEFGLKWKKV